MVHTDFALRRPVTTLMTFAAVAVIGLVSSRLLPLEQYPDVSFPFMGAGVPYPGSTPEETEELITRPIEDALATLPGIEEIRSTSSDQDARFEIRFAWGTDINTAGFEVRTKLDSVRAQLPKTADRMWMWMASTADAAHAHGALLGRSGPVVAIRPARSLLQETHRAHRRRGARRARRRRGARGAHPGRSRAGSPRIRSTCANWCSCSRRAISRWAPARSPATANASWCARSASSARSTKSATSTIKGNVRIGDVASVELVSPEITAATPPRRPPGRGPRRVQVDPGERRRSGRPRARRHREEQGVAADAGHQRLRHRQPGRSDPHVALRPDRSRAHRRRAGVRGVVRLPAPLAHHADRQRRGAAVAAGDAGRDVFRRPHDQRDVDDGHDAGHRHAGGQRGRGHRKRVPSSPAGPR